MRTALARLSNRSRLWIRAKLGSELMGRIAKGASAATALKLISFGTLFLTGIVLGRWLGAEAYGRYAFAVTVIVLLRLGTSLGMPLMLIKETARYNSSADWGRLAGLIRFSTLANLIAAAVVGTALVGGLIWYFGWPLPPTALVIAIGAPLLIIIPLTENRGSVLKGLERLAAGHVADQLVRPGIYLILLCGAIAWPGFTLTDTNAMGLRLLAECTALITAFLLALHYLPGTVRTAKPTYEVKTWTAGFLTFMAIDATHLIYQQTDVIMLGFFRPMDEVGVYRMAANFVIVVTFCSDFATAMLSPYVSSLWSQGRKAELQDVLTRMSRIAFALTVIALFGLLLLSPILIWILGEDYAGLTWPLLILGLAHIWRGFVSAAPALLLMTGGEREGAIGIALTAACNLVLNLALIPPFGIIGSALATAVSTALLGIFYLHRSRRRTGLDPSVIGRPSQSIA